jgi:hypothetical protein
LEFYPKNILKTQLLSKIHKELLKLNNRKTNIKKWAKDLNRCFTKERDRLQVSTKKDAPSSVIKEMQSQVIRAYHRTPKRMAKSQDAG